MRQAVDGLGRAVRVLNPRRLWQGRSVRTQLLIAIAAINLLAAVAAGAVAVLNTRVATKVEIEASLEVAQRFVDATVKDLGTQGRLNELADRLPQQLKHLRHVRIMLVDSFGNLTMLSPEAEEHEGASDVQRAPAWFKALVSPKLAGRAVRVVSTASQPVIIVGNPADEINEDWQEFYVLALAWLALNALVLLVLYVILGRVLDPLVNLSRGMLKLEDGDYATRLKPPKVREIAKITDRFNTLAGALDVAREENRSLYRQLISMQEQERREIANELHDEAGACLFGITANASSIRTLADQLDDRRTAELSQRVGEVLSITTRLKLMNRALLKKLRPGPLGHVKLSQLLDELIAGCQRRHPDRRILPAIGKLAPSYGETIDLTLYRCIQEGIANALRHDNGRTILIEVGEQSSPAGGSKRRRKTLRLVLSDDGVGFSPSLPHSFGLSVMTERVRSLGGSCLVKSEQGKGTAIHIEIPVPRKPAGQARPLELAGGASKGASAR